MKIKFLKEDSIEILKKEDLNSNVNNYKKDTNAWLDEKYRDVQLYQIYEKKEFNDFELIKSNNSDDDFENMKIIYENLKDLTDAQASDERIWSGLTHYEFWDYMQERWPLPEKNEHKNSHIVNNYFLWNSTKGLFLNGISRLWWYAKYTYDENLDDPYELTKYICTHDINGKIFPLLACRFATNIDVFKNIIKSVKEYEEKNNIELSRNQFNELKKYLNRLSGKIVLDLLSFDELKDKINIEIDNIINK